MPAEPTVAANDDSVELADSGAVVEVQIVGADPWGDALSPLPAKLVRRMRSAPAEPAVYGLLLKSRVAASARPAGAAAVGIDRQLLDVWTFERFSKPTVFVLDGAVHGAGAVVGAGRDPPRRHRRASRCRSVAYPAIAFPRSARCGGCDGWAAVGRYLALTGRSLNAMEALRLGLVTHVVGHDQLAGVIAGYRNAEPIDQLLDGLPPPPENATATLCQWPEAAVIDCFAEADIGRIGSRLAAVDGAAAVAARKAAGLLLRQPQLAAAVTLRLLSETIGGPDIIAASLRREYALSVALAEVAGEAPGGEELAVMVNEVLRRSQHREIALPALEGEPDPIG